MLEKVESNRGVTDTRHGRIYLRYTLETGLSLEFWAYLSKVESVDLKKGLIAVNVHS